MAQLRYIPPPPPIPFAIPLMVTVPVMAFQMARVGVHVLTGPGAVAEGHSHVVPLLIGLGVGLAAWAGERAFRKRIPVRVREPRLSRLKFGAMVVVASIATGLAGLQIGTNDVRVLRPMVLIDMQRVVPATLPAGSDSILPARLLVGATMTDTLTLLGRPLRIEKDTTALTLASADGSRRLTVPLPALELPQQVEIVPMRASADPVAFAMLVTGSARSNQAMVAVVDSSWRVVLLERLYRRWPAAPRLLSLQRDSVTHFDVLMVARDELTRRLFRLAPE